MIAPVPRSELTPEQNDLAREILDKIESEGIVPKTIDLMAQYLQGKKLKMSVVVAIFKANVAAVAALESLGIKSKKGARVVHNHLTIFNFTPEQWEALPPVEREVIERLRVKAEAASG